MNTPESNTSIFRRQFSLRIYFFLVFILAGLVIYFVFPKIEDIFENSFLKNSNKSTNAFVEKKDFLRNLPSSEGSLSAEEKLIFLEDLSVQEKTQGTPPLSLEEKLKLLQAVK